jgi:hypothetical protein
MTGFGAVGNACDAILMTLYSPMGYDEELARVINFSAAAKEAIPGVLVAAPSTCSWWFCTFIPPSLFPLSFHQTPRTSNENKNKKTD